MAESTVGEPKAPVERKEKVKKEKAVQYTLKTPKGTKG